MGLFEATIIFCRAVIEAGVFEALRRRGKIKLGKNISDYGEYSLKDIMRRIKPFVCQHNHEAAWKVIKRADKILHSKRDKIVVSENEAYNSIKSSYDIIEELFQ